MLRKTLSFGGVRESLAVELATLSLEPLNLFENLTPDCKPIASKSRLYSAEIKFVSSKVQPLYKEGIGDHKFLYKKRKIEKAPCYRH